MSSPSSNNGDNDAWLMKIELKREEPMEINKDEGIKKATEDHVPAIEDILQLDHNLLTPTEIKDLKEQNYVLKRKLRKKRTSSTTPSSPPPRKET